MTRSPLLARRLVLAAVVLLAVAAASLVLAWENRSALGLGGEAIVACSRILPVSAYRGQSLAGRSVDRVHAVPGGARRAASGGRRGPDLRRLNSPAGCSIFARFPSSTRSIPSTRRSAGWPICPRGWTTPRHGVGRTACLRRRGVDRRIPSAEAWRYDPRRDRWQRLPPPPSLAQPPGLR